MNSSKQDHERLAILAGTPPQDWKVTAVDHAYTYLREVLVKGERDVRSIWQHISLAVSIHYSCRARGNMQVVVASLSTTTQQGLPYLSARLSLEELNKDERLLSEV